MGYISRGVKAVVNVAGYSIFIIGLAFLVESFIFMATPLTYTPWVGDFVYQEVSISDKLVYNGIMYMITSLALCLLGLFVATRSSRIELLFQKS